MWLSSAGRTYKDKRFGNESVCREYGQGSWSVCKSLMATQRPLGSLWDGQKVGVWIVHERNWTLFMNIGSIS